MDPFVQLASPEVSELAAREARGFDAFIAQLDETAWQRPVPATPPWTARDLTIHVSFVAEMLGGSVRKSLAGNPGALWEDMRTARQERYGARQALDNTGIVGDFRQHVAAIGDTWSRVAANDYGTPAWHPAGMWTVGRLQLQWLWEVGIHSYDLRSAFDSGAQLRDDVAEKCVDFLIAGFPRYLGPQSDPALVGTYRFALTSPQRTVTVRLADGAHEVMSDATGRADVTFGSDGATWLLAVINRIDPLAATASGRIRLEGDPALAERFWRQLKRI